MSAITVLSRNAVIVSMSLQGVDFMKDSLALALLRVLRSDRTRFPATPLLRECVDQYHIGLIEADMAYFSGMDKERLYDLLQRHPAVIPLLGTLHVEALSALRHEADPGLLAVPEESL